MPHGRNSRRNASLNDSIAYLDMQYGASPGAEKEPEFEPVVTARPRALRSSGRNAWVTATWPITFTSSWRRRRSSGRCSSETRDTDANVIEQAPQAVCADGCVDTCDCSTDLVSVRHIEVECFEPGRAVRGGGTAQAFGGALAAHGREDAEALREERKRCGFADAARGAGDEYGLRCGCRHGPVD